MTAVYVLLLFMIVGAIVAIEARDLLSSVVAVGAVGLAVSLACLILKAPDVAITQFVVEIIALIILIRATVRRDIIRAVFGHRIVDAVIVVGFVLVLVVVAARTFQELAPFGQPPMRVASTYVSEGIAKTGATNMVASILLDFRGYDTLGEATVLFTAVMGVLAVVRRIGRKEQKPTASEGNE